MSIKLGDKVFFQGNQYTLAENEEGQLTLKNEALKGCSICGKVYAYSLKECPKCGN